LCLVTSGVDGFASLALPPNNLRLKETKEATFRGVLFCYLANIFIGLTVNNPHVTLVHLLPTRPLAVEHLGEVCEADVQLAGDVSQSPKLLMTGVTDMPSTCNSGLAAVALATSAITISRLRDIVLGLACFAKWISSITMKPGVSFLRYRLILPGDLPSWNNS